MAAPAGNQNAFKGRQWASAIGRALDHRGGGDRVKALDELAEMLLLKCDEGDLAALRELGDRIDGKPAQAIVGESDNPLLIISRIERAIIDSIEDQDRQDIPAIIDASKI